MYVPLMIVAAVGMLLMLGLQPNAIKNTGLNVVGLRSEFFERLGQNTSNWQRFCTPIKSTAEIETFAFAGSVPMMREWGTGRLVQGLLVEKYQVASEEYEATMAADRKEVEDDQTDQIMIRVQELADYAATHKDYLRAQLLENGATAGFNSYDGVPFFAANHVSGDSGAQDNDLGYNAVDPTNPTTAEMRDAIRQAVAALRKVKDDRGNPKALGRKGLIIEVPPEMEVAAMEAVQAVQISGTDNVMKGWAEVEVNEWLTSNDKFYVHKVDRPVKPFLFMDRIPLEFTGLDKPTDTNVFGKGKYLYGVRARYRMVYGRWEYCFRTTFT